MVYIYSKINSVDVYQRPLKKVNRKVLKKNADLYKNQKHVNHILRVSLDTDDYRYYNLHLPKFHKYDHFRNHLIIYSFLNYNKSKNTISDINYSQTIEIKESKNKKCLLFDITPDYPFSHWINTNRFPNSYPKSLILLKREIDESFHDSDLKKYCDDPNIYDDKAWVEKIIVPTRHIPTPAEQNEIDKARLKSEVEKLRKEVNELKRTR